MTFFEPVGVQRTDCGSVEEFLREIDPRNGRYSKSHIFRGVSREAYRLIPSALREGETFIGDFFSATNDYPNIQHYNVHERIRAEYELLSHFYWKLLKQGLPIPDDSSEIRESLRKYCIHERNLIEKIIEEDQMWPPRILDGLSALAQHYGLPTRLLDWSWSSYKAAYFAAIGAVNNAPKQNDKIAVWALHSGYFGDFGSTGWPNRLIEIINVGGAANPNLRAQQGLFTVLRVKLSAYDFEYDNLPLDRQIADMVDATRHYSEAVDALNENPPFTLVTLPAKLSAPLAGEFSKLGINASNMFPGPRGVADSLREEQKIAYRLSNYAHEK